MRRSSTGRRGIVTIVAIGILLALTLLVGALYAEKSTSSVRVVEVRRPYVEQVSYTRFGGGDWLYRFTVKNPLGRQADCLVTLSSTSGGPGLVNASITVSPGGSASVEVLSDSDPTTLGGGLVELTCNVSGRVYTIQHIAGVDYPGWGR